MPLSAQTVAALFALCWALDVSGKHVKFNTSYTESANFSKNFLEARKNGHVNQTVLSASIARNRIRHPIGAHLAVDCKLKVEDPLTNIEVTWTKDSREKPIKNRRIVIAPKRSHGGKITTSTILFQKLQLQDGGTYHCSATLIDTNRNIIATDQASVEIVADIKPVYGPPEIKFARKVIKAVKGASVSVQVL
eukprot:m.190870 g.190870  ORF g.190870 m.190870 type:complete len:192 (+) comp39437_c0_seq32:106-681(+)